MKTTAILFSFALLFALLFTQSTAFAWCTPRILHCGDVIDSSTVQGHDDVSTYNCSGSTHWNGKAHVYKITHPGDSLWIQLLWNGDATHALGVFVLTACDANDCIAWDPHYIARTLPAGDYWIIVDSRNDCGTDYELKIYCGDHQLPVELLSFTATDGSDGVHLAWSTASETDAASFRIERQLQDTDTWTVAGTVAAHGQSTTSNDYSFVDANVQPGMQYAFRLIVVDLNGEERELQLVVAAHGSFASAAPAEFGLIGNYPNPFNPTTTITYALKEASHVRLTVFDPVGRVVAVVENAQRSAGTHSVAFDGTSLSTGLYFYRLEAGSINDVRKMILLK
jgi:hypothetical protein